MNWFIGLTVDPKGWYPDFFAEGGFAPRGAARHPLIERPPPGFTAFHPDDLHVTVAFLGRVSEEQALSAWRALAWPTAAIEAELAEVVPMGAPGRYSALSLTFGRGGREIEEGISMVRNAVCSAAGAETDARPPKAHVTIARPKRSAPKTVRKMGLEWARGVNAGAGTGSAGNRVAGTPIRIDRIALYGWALDRKIRLFRTVAETNLELEHEHEHDSNAPV